MHAKTTTSRLTQFTWIFTVFFSGKKSFKGLQAAKLFEGERENNLMKKMFCYCYKFLQKGVQDYLGTLFEG